MLMNIFLKIMNIWVLFNYWVGAYPHSTWQYYFSILCGIKKNFNFTSFYNSTLTMTKKKLLILDFRQSPSPPFSHPSSSWSRAPHRLEKYFWKGFRFRENRLPRMLKHLEGSGHRCRQVGIIKALLFSIFFLL